MIKFTKILSFLFFPIILTVVFYIAFSVEYQQPYGISVIEINGGKHLTDEKYFTFAGLSDKSQYPELTLPIIKSRLEKHPYVKRADVLYDGNGKVKVTIYEKDFWAILITGVKEFILTENFEILPVLKFSRNMYYPIISAKSLTGKLKEYDYVKNNEILRPVFKILDASKMINPELYDNLSEINLSESGDVSLYFTFANYVLKINKNNSIAEIYYFNELWNSIKHNLIVDKIDYIDLRFKEKIFIGLKNNIDSGSEI